VLEMRGGQVSGQVRTFNQAVRTPDKCLERHCPVRARVVTWEYSPRLDAGSGIVPRPFEAPSIPPRARTPVPYRTGDGSPKGKPCDLDTGSLWNPSDAATMRPQDWRCSARIVRTRRYCGRTKGQRGPIVRQP